MTNQNKKAHGRDAMGAAGQNLSCGTAGGARRRMLDIY
jgi:hypothetical protein